MKKRLTALAKALGTDLLVQIERRPLDKNRLHGFVVGLSERLVLLHIVDGDTLSLNGYAALRLKDVSRVFPDETFVPHALRLLERRPVIPAGASLSDWPALLTWDNDNYPLVMIECEKKEPGIAFIGRVDNVSARRVWLNKIDPKAQPEGREAFSLKHVTRVVFDDGYTLALSALIARATNRPGSEVTP